MRESSSGRGSPSSMLGPSPESFGATKTRSLSTRPASRNAAASVGPPSRSSDWTPSAASASSSSRSGPERSSSSEPSGSGPRPKAMRRGCLSDRDVARVEARVVPANGAHPHRDRVRLRPQDVYELPRRLPRHPPRARNADAAVERDRDLVRHERPTRRDPSAPLLDLLAAPESEVVVRELRLDTRLAKPLEAAAVLRIRVALPRDDASDAGREERVDARRRRAVVRAGLEGDVHRRAARLLPCGVERDDLGVRPLPCARASPRRRSRPRQRRQRPTTGFGCVVPRPRSASSSARSMNRGSMALILRSQARRAVRSDGGVPRVLVDTGSTSPTGWTTFPALVSDCATDWGLELEDRSTALTRWSCRRARSCRSSMHPRTSKPTPRRTLSRVGTAGRMRRRP